MVEKEGVSYAQVTPSTSLPKEELAATVRRKSLENVERDDNVAASQPAPSEVPGP